MAGKAPPKQIYTYQAADALYGLSWSVREDHPFRFAVGSFTESTENYINVVEYNEDADAMVANPSLRMTQPYPATKVKFLPHRSTSKPDLLATSSNSLRIWKLGAESAEVERALDANPDRVAPLTSFDWATDNTERIVTSSVNCNSTVWDIERGSVVETIRCHDKSVYDICFGTSDVFASCSADGSVCVVDIRDPQQTTAVYTNQGEHPDIVRIGWNRQDPRFMTLLPVKSSAVIMLDVRVPGTPYLMLKSHTMPVNAFSLAPHAAQYICTGGDDKRALIWDLNRAQAGSPSIEPVLRYVAAAEVVSLEWSVLSQDHIAICYKEEAQVLRV